MTHAELGIEHDRGVEQGPGEDRPHAVQVVLVDDRAHVDAGRRRPRAPGPHRQRGAFVQDPAIGVDEHDTVGGVGGQRSVVALAGVDATPRRLGGAERTTALEEHERGQRGHRDEEQDGVVAVVA
jgi:hypothetical protein